MTVIISCRTDTENPILQFSFIGYTSQEIEVGGQSSVDIALAEDVASLEEVIVTAQGIEQEKKALGYAVSNVEGEKLEQQPQADVGRILQGKISGANITPSNGCQRQWYQYCYPRVLIHQWFQSATFCGRRSTLQLGD